MSVTVQTRRESYNGIIPKRMIRKEYIREVLAANSDGMTAEEITTELHKNGVISRLDFNYSRPRLTEMRSAGEVRVIGKRESSLTGKNTAVWQLVK
ncbi:MAG: hypothetical protein PHR82_06945 [Endomicrobiaceae bacterium]|nr:hypothetical protein [Endomicrobiaceae bacterium]